jgi:tetratricopeptide (TPR) repeat protein
MARALRETHTTSADELRALLTESEILVPALQGRSGDPVALLENMDRIAELWPQLEATGVDLRSEAGRWESLQNAVRTNAPALVRQAAGLAAVRRQSHGDTETNWWWYLDETVHRQRVQRIRRAVIVGVVVVVVGGLGLYVLNRLGDPNVQASMGAMMGGQQRFTEGNIEEALAQFQEATRRTPNDPEPWVWAGAALEKLGRLEEAEASYQKARDLVDGELMFRNLRAQVYASIGMWTEAAAEAQAALELDPESPEAHFNLGSAYEGMGDMQQAIKQMEETSKYAEIAGKSELTVISRYRLALMLQQFQMAPPPTLTPAP